MRAYVLYRQLSMALPLQRVNDLALPLQSVNAWPPATATLHPQFVWLPDVEAGDGAADEHALDLRGALEDREDLRVGAELSVYPITRLTCGNVGSQGFR